MRTRRDGHGAEHPAVPWVLLRCPADPRRTQVSIMHHRLGNFWDCKEGEADCCMNCPWDGPVPCLALLRAPRLDPEPGDPHMGGCTPGSPALERFGSETQAADELELKLCFQTCSSQAPALNLSSFCWRSPLDTVGRGCKQPCPGDRGVCPQGAPCSTPSPSSPG